MNAIHIHNTCMHTRTTHAYTQHSGSRNPLNKVLEAYREVEAYRLMFRLPCDEMLDGYTECALSCPSLKMDVLGKMYISPNYICFASKVCGGAGAGSLLYD